MPKRKAEYENALQSIFDFIFSQKAQKIKRPKPIRPSGTSQVDELAKGLAEIATAPGLKASEALMNSINDSLGSPALLQFWVDKLDDKELVGIDDANGRIRLRVQDILKNLNDTNKLVDSAFNAAKSQRKWAQVAGFSGRAMDGAMAFLYAKKNGATVNEAWRLAEAAGYKVNDYMQELAKDMEAENVGFDVFANSAKGQRAARDMLEAINASKLRGTSNRYLDLRGNNDTLDKFIKANISDPKGLKVNFESLASDLTLTEKTIISDVIKDKKQLSPREQEIYDKGMRKIQNTASKYFDRAKEREDEFRKSLANIKANGLRVYSDEEVDKLVKGYASHRSSSDMEINSSEYRNLMMENLKHRITTLDSVKDKAEIDRLGKQMNAIMMWQRVYAEPVDLSKTLGDIRSKIANYDEAIGKLPDGQYKTALVGLRNGLDAQAQVVAAKGKKLVPTPWDGYLGTKEPLGRKKSLALLSTEIEARERLIKSEIDDFEAQVRDWESRDVDNEAVRDAKLAELRGQIKKIDSQYKLLTFQRENLKDVPWANARIRFRQFQGAYDTWKAVANGGIGGMLFSGAMFMDAATGNAAPGTIYRSASFLRRIRKDGKLDYEETGFGLATGSPIVLPREDIHAGYASLTNLYYFTPGSLVKTLLWNGEGFVFAGWSAQQKMMTEVFNSENLKYLQTVLGDSVNVIGMKKNEANLFKIMKALDSSPNPLAKNINQKIKTLRLRGFAERMSRIGDIYKRFYEPYSRGLKSVNTFIMSRIGSVLKFLSKNEAWQKAVTKFVVGDFGIKQLIKTAVTQIATTLGLATGPGAILIGAVTWLLTEIAYSLSKAFVKLGIFAFKLLLFGLLAIIYFVFFGGFTALTQPYHYVIPGTPNACVNYNPHSGMYPDPTPNIPSTGYPPSNASCPIDAPTLYCTQGPSGAVSGYHQRTQAIDIGTRVFSEGEDVWHAPSDGKVIYYKASNICEGTGLDYGGTLKFADSNGNVYVLLHVRAIKSNGSVKKGQAVAVSSRNLQISSDPTKSCWTGPHYHLEVLSNGRYINAEEWYKNKLKCSLTACQ